MGRHKDPETIRFIETIKKKSEALGFKVKDEFYVLKGPFWIDLTLTPYEKAHETFITLEIESKENDRVVSNLRKILGTPAQDLEKPYHHFIIIYNGKLTKSKKYLIRNEIRNYNIEIFENLKEEPEQAEKLFSRLESLKIDIAAYIERKGIANPAETVEETLAGLEKVAPVVIIINKKKYPLGQLSLTTSSKEISLIGSGKQTTKLFGKYKGIAIVPIPSDRFVLVIPGTPYILDIYLDVKVKHDLPQYHAEACDYPFLFDFLKIKDDMFKMGIHIDPTQADVVQLVFFEKLVKSIDHVNKVEIFNSNGKKIMQGSGVRPDELLINDVWHNAISDLAQIQKATRQRIPAPPKDSKLYKEDLLSIENLKTIVDTGQLCLKIEDLSFNAKKETVKRLLEYQKTSGKLPKMKISISKSSKHLLNQEFQLGPVVHELPEMKFQESVSQVESKLKISEPEAEISVTLIPYSNAEVMSIYPRWQKK